jgi:uncharacterized membrane protein YeaQ/YmgE (transglycosylase-associated protein family)
LYLGFDRRGMLGAVLIGALGAVVGGQLVAPMFTAGAAVPDALTSAGLFFAASLAVAFLLVSNFVHKRWGV